MHQETILDVQNLVIEENYHKRTTVKKRWSIANIPVPELQ